MMLFVMVVVVFMQVLFRFVIDQPLAWTEEVARYLLVWITFLGAAYAMSVKAHPSVEVFVERVNPKFRKVLLVLSTIFSVIFFVVIIGQSIEMVSRSMLQTSAVLQIPMGYVYMIIPIASGLYLINLFYVSITELLKKEER